MSEHAIMRCRILHHCSNCGWMITTFFQSSMPSLKMQMSDSPPPPLSPSPLLLHSWSLHFDLFIFYVGEPDRTMASFITEAAFPLPAPHCPPESLIHQADLMWPGHGGLVLLKEETQKEGIVSLYNLFKSFFARINIYPLKQNLNSKYSF